jgi:hypothetical protein
MKGQIADNTFKKDASNIYNQAFIQYFNYLKNRNFKFSDTIFVEEDIKLTDNLMKKIGRKTLVILKDSELKETVIKNNGIVLYRLFPLDYDDSGFYVSFVPYGVTFNTSLKNDISFVNSGSYFVRFNFDGKKFIFRKIQNNAI